MKKTLLLIAAVAAMTSCEPGQQANKQEAQEATGSNKQTSSKLEETLIPMSSADTLIYNYNQYLRNVQHDSLAYSSFMLDAQALREYLNGHPEMVSLNIYLAKNELGKMTETSMNLVYIGAVDSMGKNGVVYNVEKPYYKAGEDTPYFLNHSFPCPTCIDRIEAYKPPTNSQHP